MADNPPEVLRIAAISQCARQRSPSAKSPPFWVFSRHLRHEGDSLSNLGGVPKDFRVFVTTFLWNAGNESLLSLQRLMP